MRVTGGLGNQMFQLAKAYKLYLDLDKPIILVDKYQNDFLRFKSFLESDFRDFGLSRAGLVDNKVTFYHPSPGLFCKLIFKLRIAKILNKSGIFKIFGNVYLDGYFIKDESFGDELAWIQKKILETHPITVIQGAAIHVRAGDLLRQPENQLITKKYYDKAIDLVSLKFNINNFLIVTEDIDYAKTFFIDADLKYNLKYKSSSEIDDFVCLMSHRFLITSNSTFSWIAGLVGLSELFISTEYFYKPSDRPEVASKEMVLSFEGDTIISGFEESFKGG